MFHVKHDGIPPGSEADLVLVAVSYDEQQSESLGCVRVKVVSWASRKETVESGLDGSPTNRDRYTTYGQEVVTVEDFHKNCALGEVQLEAGTHFFVPLSNLRVTQPASR